jgi:hypothetical protein
MRERGRAETDRQRQTDRQTDRDRELTTDQYNVTINSDRPRN